MTTDQNQSLTQHRYYRQAYEAHRSTSFSPEKRAVSECAWYDQECEQLRALSKEAAIEKFTALFLKLMAAKARIVSPMIAGPAKFPVARMEKYNRWERNAGDAVLDFLKKVKAPPAPPRTELDYGIQEKEYMIGDVKVFQNTADNRLQLFFPGKPEEETIQKLKSRGFKWSPRNKAWQRQLTPNALRVVSYIFADAGAA
jgi:hypothetical protein